MSQAEAVNNVPSIALFVDTVSSDKNKDVVLLKCGGCDCINSLSIPKDVYYVVTSGSGIGIFTNAALADTFVVGVPSSSRQRANNLGDAIEVLETAIKTGAVDVKKK